MSIISFVTHFVNDLTVAREAIELGRLLYNSAPVYLKLDAVTRLLYLLFIKFTKTFVIHEAPVQRSSCQNCIKDDITWYIKVTWPYRLRYKSVD